MVKQEAGLVTEIKMKEEEKIGVPRITLKILDLLEVEVRVPWIPFWDLVSRSISTFSFW